MKAVNDPRSAADIELERERFAEAVRMQEIEGNPFTDEEKGMFEMFIREGWSDDQRRAHILNTIEEAKRHLETGKSAQA